MCHHVCRSGRGFAIDDLPFSESHSMRSSTPLCRHMPLEDGLDRSQHFDRVQGYGDDHCTGTRAAVDEDLRAVAYTSAGQALAGCKP